MSDYSYYPAENEETRFPAPNYRPGEVRHFFVGATFTFQPGAEEYLEEIKAPSNYKDPAVINNYVQKGMAKQQEKAAHWPISGTISEAALLDKDDKLVLFIPPAHKAPKSNPSDMAFSFGSQLMGLTADAGKPTIIWGLKVLDMMRILAFESLRSPARRQSKEVFYLTTWLDNAWFQDPVHRLLKSPARSNIGLKGLMKYASITGDLETPIGTARVARDICAAYTLST